MVHENLVPEEIGLRCVHLERGGRDRGRNSRGEDGRYNSL